MRTNKIAMGMALFAAFAAIAFAIGVSPGLMDGWAEDESGTATVQFANGPGTPPMGTGSAEFTVGADGDSGAELRNVDYDGTKLSELTTLKYSTYVTNNVNCQAVYLELDVDNNGDGIADDSLTFEPCYQTGTYGGEAVPNQCPAEGPNCVALNKWQTWDALAGGWWAESGFGGSAGGPPLFTLQSYIAANPDATIVNSGGLGGVRVIAGYGAGAWDNFTGNADAVIIGVNGADKTFDFERTGAPTSKEQCRNGNWANFVDPKFMNQGDCVSFVASQGKNQPAG